MAHTLGASERVFPFFFRPLHGRPSRPAGSPLSSRERIRRIRIRYRRGRRRGRGAPFGDMINYFFKSSTEQAPRPAEERPPSGVAGSRLRHFRRQGVEGTGNPTGRPARFAAYAPSNLIKFLFACLGRPRRSVKNYPPGAAIFPAVTVNSSPRSHRVN